jgi:uncharacterized membrane protein YphA (DoxX/SURF4 family)
VCLRIASTIAAFHFADLRSMPPPFGSIGPATAGLLLLVGLWTPIAAGALSAIELWSAFSEKGDFWAEILLATMAASLAMLGPGNLSIDARLFGRKRLIP